MSVKATKEGHIQEKSDLSGGKGKLTGLLKLRRDPHRQADQVVVDRLRRDPDPLLFLQRLHTFVHKFLRFFSDRATASCSCCAISGVDIRARSRSDRRNDMQSRPIAHDAFEALHVLVRRVRLEQFLEGLDKIVVDALGRLTAFQGVVAEHEAEEILTEKISAAIDGDDTKSISVLTSASASILTMT